MSGFRSRSQNKTRSRYISRTRRAIVSLKQQSYRAAYTMVPKMQLGHLAKRTERLRIEITSAGGDDGGCGDRSNGITVFVVEGRCARHHGGRFRCAILLTVKAYQNAPPIPEKFVNPAGGERSVPSSVCCRFSAARANASIASISSSDSEAQSIRCTTC